MSGNLLRGYRCTGAEGFGGGVGIGARIERKRGLRVARTLRDALTERAGGVGVSLDAYGAGWPLRIFELGVPPVDVLDEDPAALRARGAYVTRELPLSDVFGPHTAEVEALLDEVKTVRWLRPGPDATDTHIAELVAAHYAGLAAYQEVQAPRVRIVRTWHEARDLYRAMIPDYEGFLCLRAVHTGVGRVIADTTLEGAFRVALPIVNRAAFFGAYDAFWRAAGISAASGLQALPRSGRARTAGDADHAVERGARAIGALLAALDGAHPLARRASWENAHNIFTNAPDVLPNPLAHFAGAVDAGRTAAVALPRPRPIHGPQCATCREVPTFQDALVRDFLEVTTQIVDRLATMAGRQMGWEVAYLLQDEQRPNPWRPLADLWRLGACPVGSLGDVFVVFVPERLN